MVRLGWISDLTMAVAFAPACTVPGITATSRSIRSAWVLFIIISGGHSSEAAGPQVFRRAAVRTSRWSGCDLHDAPFFNHKFFNGERVFWCVLKTFL